MHRFMSQPRSVAPLPSQSNALFGSVWQNLEKTIQAVSSKLLGARNLACARLFPFRETAGFQQAPFTMVSS